MQAPAVGPKTSGRQLRAQRRSPASTPPPPPKTRRPDEADRGAGRRNRRDAGGQSSAPRARRRADGVMITVVDQDDGHVYQPGLLFVPFGLRSTGRHRAGHGPRSCTRASPTAAAEIERVDLGRAAGALTHGVNSPMTCWSSRSGAQLVPEATEGVAGPGWLETVFNLLSTRGRGRPSAARSRGSPAGGSSSTSSTCRSSARSRRSEPASSPTGTSPRRDSQRGRADLRHPVRRPSPSPLPPRRSAGLLAEKNVELVTEFNTGEVDGTRQVAESSSPTTIARCRSIWRSWCRCTAAPPTSARSPGLGDEFGFVPTDPHAAVQRCASNVFVFGDAANVPISKAGR